MKLNFIKDKEINLEEGDLLGTRPYTNTLSEIIEKALFVKIKRRTKGD